MRNYLSPILLLAVLIVIGCSDSSSSSSAPVIQSTKVYLVPSTLNLNARADRKDDGAVVISGKTNLPDGLKMWVEVEEGKLPLGAPKVVSSDENVFVKNGAFQTEALWREVPNTTFTKKGWPERVTVNVRQRPFPQSAIKVHFEAYFNGAWQNKNVLSELEPVMKLVVC